MKGKRQGDIEAKRQRDREEESHRGKESERQRGRESERQKAIEQKRVGEEKWKGRWRGKPKEANTSILWYIYSNHLKWREAEVSVMT